MTKRMLHGDQHGFDSIIFMIKFWIEDRFFSTKEANFNNKNSRIFIQQNRVHTLCQVCYRQFN